MPSAQMDIILLERVDNLGNMGEVVRVRPGYARNYLLPQQKALRATKDNLAFYEAQKASLEKQNAEKRKEAEKEAKALEGLTVALIRLASDSGQLFGSVNARDIADVINATGKITVTRGQVLLNQSIKTIGLIPVPVMLHPEVKVEVRVNIARTEEEAKIQAKTGRAITEKAPEEPKKAPEAEELDSEATEKAKQELMEESALEAEKARSASEEEGKAEKKAETVEAAADTAEAE